MRGFVCALVCLATFVARIQGQGFGGPGHGGQGHGGQGHGHGHGHGPIEPILPDPTRTETCPKFWVQEGDSCYLYDSGAFLRRVAANGPNIVTNENGLYQGAANMFCGQMHPNASLVTVNTLEENNFLYEWAVRMMVEPVPVWIGLYVGMSGQWEWYSGEPVTYQNWENMQAPMPEPGLGAMIFDADIQNQIYNNQVEITPQWVPEQARNDRHAIICEYHPSGMTAPPAGTGEPATATTTMGLPPVVTTGVPSTGGPVMLRHRPSNMETGGRFGGSRLFEVPRRQRNGPANYRMNPYYGIRP